ncbi:RICIN domain-containing protein [Chromobacterium piscinae]|uniref:RICIN domain-containing protein n=1 Tax=Chromobacterium piscinae TaxID=686831 RepID=A0ABV0H2J7_9NEIS|nr:RICIN domain-containing protein [Chromobacterium piscinae]MBX9299137.1 RICIN domain-containing protein [Chromobacterium vaccinii]MBX9348819.1 RICIN domain-containing protein [Chromobacterium vaccinii]MBX9359249.1 RICIN domain-containing protein [Chromobacterium vaccinii]MCD4504191.1 RICIN domain-containing protein [Chromobacterium piscinae]MCD5327517.1 RICIN domain-containing protein [Chromobacterium piscinae]
MEQRYVIRSTQDNRYCIGVVDDTNGGKVVLAKYERGGTTRTRWTLDPFTGLIRLASSEQLVLDATPQTQGTQLTVTNYQFGKKSQTWDWVKKPQTIINSGNGMVVDNQGAVVELGNPIILYTDHNGNNQHWEFQVVEVALFKTVAEEEAAGAK